MGQNLILDGSLFEGPQQACDNGTLPAGSTTIPMFLNQGQNPKPTNVSTGDQNRLVVSPSAFVTLSGVGATDNVTQAHTLFFRVSGGLWQARITFANPVPPNTPIVSIVPFFGTLLLECDAADGYYPTKIEVQGSGTVEYAAWGLQ